MVERSVLPQSGGRTVGSTPVTWRNGPAYSRRGGHLPNIAQQLAKYWPDIGPTLAKHWPKFHGSHQYFMDLKDFSWFRKVLHGSARMSHASEEWSMVPKSVSFSENVSWLRNNDSWLREVFHGSQQCFMAPSSVSLLQTMFHDSAKCSMVPTTVSLLEKCFFMVPNSVPWFRAMFHLS